MYDKDIFTRFYGDKDTMTLKAQRPLRLVAFAAFFAMTISTVAAQPLPPCTSTTLERAWSPSTELARFESSLVSSPQVAVGSGGIAVAAWWGRQKGSGDAIQARVYKRGTGALRASWQPTSNLSASTNLALRLAPNVAVDGMGRGIVVWLVSDSNGRSVYFSVYDGNTWSGAHMLANVQSDHRPEVATSHNGDTVIVYEDGVNVVAAQLSLANPGNVSTAQLTRCIPGCVARMPRVSAAKNRILVAWDQTDPLTGLQQVHASLYTGSWSAASQLVFDVVAKTPPPPPTSTGPVIGMSSNGRSLVAWRNINVVGSPPAILTTERITSRILGISDALGTGSTVHFDERNPPGGGGALRWDRVADVTMKDDGTSAAVWLRRLAPGQHAYEMVYRIRDVSGIMVPAASGNVLPPVLDPVILAPPDETTDPVLADRSNGPSPLAYLKDVSGTTRVHTRSLRFVPRQIGVCSAAWVWSSAAVVSPANVNAYGFDLATNDRGFEALVWGEQAADGRRRIFAKTR